MTDAELRVALDILGRENWAERARAAHAIADHLAAMQADIDALKAASVAVPSPAAEKV